MNRSLLPLALILVSSCSTPAYQIGDGPRATLQVVTDTYSQYVELYLFLNPDECRDRRVLLKQPHSQKTAQTYIPAEQEIALMIHDVEGTPFPRGSADIVLKFLPATNENYTIQVVEVSGVSKVTASARASTLAHTYYTVSKPFGDAGPFCKSNVPSPSKGVTPYTPKVDYTPYAPAN